MYCYSVLYDQWLKIISEKLLRLTTNILFANDLVQAVIKSIFVRKRNKIEF